MSQNTPYLPYPFHVYLNRTTIDVTIFEHLAKPCDKSSDPVHIVEVVAFDPHTNKEAPHIYIKSKELCENIQRHEATNDEDIAPGVKAGQSAMAKYIFSRVAVVASTSKAAIPCVSSVSPNAHESFHEMVKHLPPSLSLSGRKALRVGGENIIEDANNTVETETEVHSPRAPPDLDDPVLAATAAAMEKYGFQSQSLSLSQPETGSGSEGDDSNTFRIELLTTGKDDDTDVTYVCESVPSGLCPLPDIKHLK
jgi:hypothetical protein